MSTLTAFDFIQERSEATPGLWNRAFSQLSDNIAAVQDGPVTPSTGTFSVFSWLDAERVHADQAMGIGPTPSAVTTGAMTIAVSSALSDYIHFEDTSGSKSDYLLGSRVGGTADGLNLWDLSGSTMIVSFSKQSVRFFQNVVGPVFDLGGSLTGTYNAATFGTGSMSTESRIQAAIDQAVIDGITRVYLPSSFVPYSASSVSFSAVVQMVREGASWDIHDVRAYGAIGNNVRSDTSAFEGAHRAIPTNSRIIVASQGTYLLDSTFTVSKDNVIFRGAGSGDQPTREGATCLMKTSTLTAPLMLITGIGSQFEDFAVSGKAGNGGDGIVVGVGFTRIKNVSVFSQGQDGIRVGRTGVVNSNHWYLENCRARQNVRHGFNIDNPGGNPDVNAGVALNCVSQFNGSAGMNIGKAILNTIVGFVPETNTGIGIQIGADAQYNAFVGGDLAETNFGGTLLIDTGALENVFYVSVLSTSGITDNGTGTLIREGPKQNREVFRIQPTAGLIPFTDGDTTPSVAAGSYFQTENTSATTITQFDDGRQGQSLLVRLDNLTGIAHDNTKIRLRHDRTIGVGEADSNSLIRFTRHSAIWYETHRNTIATPGANGAIVDAHRAYLASGSAVQPTYAFSSETSLGWYRSSASVLALSYGTLSTSGSTISASNIKIANAARLIFGDAGNANGVVMGVPTGSNAFFINQANTATFDLMVSNATRIRLQSAGTVDTLTNVIWTSGVSVGNTTAGGSLIRAISSTSSLVAAFVVQPSASSFTHITWAAVQPGDQILTTVLPDAAASSLSSGLVAHSMCTVAGRFEMRLSNVSTLVQNQSSKTWFFTRITPF